MTDDFKADPDLSSIPIERLYQLDHRLDEGDFFIKTKSGAPRVWAFSSAPLGRLPDGRRTIISMAMDVTERRQAEEDLRKLSVAVEAAANGVLITDHDGIIIWVNPAFTNLTGYSREEVIGKMPSILKSGRHSREFYEELWQTILSGSVWRGHITNRRKDGSTYEEAMTITPVRNAHGNITHFIAIKESMEERRILEDQLRQSQKLEALGRLAGGVAHDFNNLLTIISGYSDILLTLIPMTDPKRASVKAINEAGERAAGLTRQLLAFSRHTILEPQVMNLNAVVKDTEKMLRRMIGEDVLLTTVLDPHIQSVKTDPGQMGQVLMNLAVNARDAMPQGGKLTIETGNVEITEDEHPGVKPGSYVLLSLADSGCGMSQEVKSRIFEPFFTTKGVGQGTGLGLSVVQGIIQQSGGFIVVNSEPGSGTTFYVYLPTVTDVASCDKHQDSTNVQSGTERILVVEDDDAVRELAALALRTYGYTVISATSGREALKSIENGPFDLLLTDVVMPGMSGRELAQTLQPRCPGMKVLFVSGYTDDAVLNHGIQQAQVALLQKPFTPFSLVRKVRQVLDERVTVTV